MEEFLENSHPDELVSILNPSAEDFSFAVVDIHHQGETISYTVKSRQSLQLPRYAANYVSERLAQRMESKKSGVLTQIAHKQLVDQIRMYTTKEL